MAAASRRWTDSSTHPCGRQSWRSERNDFGHGAGGAGDRRQARCARRTARAAGGSCGRSTNRVNVSCARNQPRGACLPCSTIQATEPATLDSLDKPPDEREPRGRLAVSRSNCPDHAKPTTRRVSSLFLDESGSAKRAAGALAFRSVALAAEAAVRWKKTRRQSHCAPRWNGQSKVT